MGSLSEVQLAAASGEMAQRIASLDWSKTPIGAADCWPPALRTAIKLVLANRFPMILLWGPQFVQFYNDPCRPIPGNKHPAALGQPAAECWPEIWHVIGPLIETPYSGGPATWMEDIFLEIRRHGFVEETHFTVACSPVPCETSQGGIGGVLATVHEITDKVVGERRLVVLSDLRAQSAEARTAEDACALAARTLASHAKDIPFAVVYLIDAERRRARLAGAAGVMEGEPAAPAVIDLDPRSVSAWPFAKAMQSDAVHAVTNLAAHLHGRVPTGPWSDLPHTAVVVPLRSNRAHSPAGILVAGVSARLKLDESYRRFFELVSSQIATAIANARDYEHLRSHAAAQVRQSEERLRIALESAQLGTFDYHIATRAFACAGQTRRICGIADDAALDYATAFELVHPDDREYVKAAFEHAINPAGDGYFRTEHRMRRPDGTIAWLGATGQVSFEGEGAARRPVRLAGVCRDITERKLASGALEDSRDRQELLSRTVSALLTAPDPQLIVEKLCNEVRAFLHCDVFFNYLLDVRTGRLRLNACGGLDPRIARKVEHLELGQSLCGSAARDACRIIAEDIPAHPDPRSAVVASLGIRTYACHPLLGPGGEVIGTLSFGARNRNAFGAADLKLMKTVADHVAIAMHRRRTGQIIQESEHRLRLLSDRAPVLLAHWDVNHRFKYANLPYAARFGLTAEQIIGKHLSDVIGARAYAVLRPYLDRGLRGEIVECEVEVPFATLGNVWKHVTYTRELDGDGKVIGIVAAIQDITARKAAETALLMRQAELEAANRELETFTYSVSHDLRAPLRGMDGFAHLLAGQAGAALDEESRHCLAMIRSNAQQMGRLIDDLLGFARLGQRPLVKQRVSMRAAVDAALADLASERDGRRIELTVNELPEVNGDPRLLKQVWVNLLSNAFKFTRRREPAVVNIGCESQGTANVFFVRDNGTGFDMRYVGKLFGVFERLHRQKDFEGTGVGLAVVKRIINRHGGRVWANAKKDEGAVFRFTVEGGREHD